ncbi:MAG: hypothetical protein CMA77_03235 [Euryarchaeota archaeon]|nr:hypothetical protein [Euryarchaeota archaeon]
MGWIGLDDTDSIDGGCTTWDFHLLLTEIEESGFEVVNSPRLVRLWPFAPERTRGNAALSAEVIVDSENEDTFIKLIENWFDCRYSIESDWNVLSFHPSLVWTREQFPEQWYWDGVRGYVDSELRHELINQIEGVKYWSRGSNRGLVGSTSSIAWRGLNDWTWEATAWRADSMIGKDRIVSNSRVIEMSIKFPGTILNRDPNAGKSLITPRTPCPVLYGIRSEEEIVAKDAHKWLQSDALVENAVAMRVHRTNQATGDHIINVENGVVISELIEVKGGHASVSVFSNGKKLSLVAFKQGGAVNSLLRQTVIGDIVEWRGLSCSENEIHLESLMVSDAAPRQLVRPLCECGNRFQRQGRDQPLRCSGCSKITNSLWLGARFDDEGVWKEPVPSHRRHLAKPLGRQSKR